MFLQDPDISISKKIDFILQDEDNLAQLIIEFEYTTSQTLTEILEFLIVHPKTPQDYVYKILSVLYEFREDIKSDVENLISTYVPQNSALEFQTLQWLFSFGNSKKHLNRMYNYLNNPNLQDTHKYNQLFEIRKTNPEEVLIGIQYLLKKTTNSRCRILCSQYLLENKDSTLELNDIDIFTPLLAIAEDEKEDYNTRADACDVVHHYSQGETQEFALTLLKKLGGDNPNIYKDNQNIHAVDISEGISFIEKIVPTVKFSEIAKILTQGLYQKDGTFLPDPKIASSLGRIVLDNARYGSREASRGGKSFTSEEIIERIWEYIQTLDDKTTIIERLVEELRDMADTCSSGHALRLINVLSGIIDGVNVKISFIDQIASSFEGRLQARIKQIEDEEVKSDIYLDMTDKGPAFMKFFLINYPLVIKELHIEYVEGDYVSNDDFDTAIAKAMKNYEGVTSNSKLDFKIVQDAEEVDE